MVTDSQLLTQSMLQLNVEGEVSYSFIVKHGYWLITVITDLQIFRDSFFNSTFDASYDDLFRFPVQVSYVVYLCEYICIYMHVLNLAHK